MSRKVFLSAASFALALLFVACTKRDPAPTEPPSADEKISLTVDLTSKKIVESGYEWVDNAGVVHVQGRVIDKLVVSGDLTGRIKITIVNSERDPRTEITKERWVVEFAATWPAQKRDGMFAGEMNYEITSGVRSACKLVAKGESGFAKLMLDVAFKADQASSELLVGEGRIYEP